MSYPEFNTFEKFSEAYDKGLLTLPLHNIRAIPQTKEALYNQFRTELAKGNQQFAKDNPGVERKTFDAKYAQEDKALGAGRESRFQPNPQLAHLDGLPAILRPDISSGKSADKSMVNQYKNDLEKKPSLKALMTMKPVTSGGKEYDPKPEYSPKIKPTPF